LNLSADDHMGNNAFGGQSIPLNRNIIDESGAA
jgi:hypothetical protein